MISNKIENSLKNSSWIRAMFEEGEKLSKKYGKENVYDYSIGNPYDEPPVEVQNALDKYAKEQGVHRYMNNAGYPDVREKIAKHLEKESKVALDMRNIVMTVGAAGGLNVVLKSILNEGEEVIVFAPYFVEYGSYVGNFNGKTVVVEADTKTFEPNVEALEKAINEKTKAIILNTPNNPSGVVYTEAKLKELNKVLERKEKEYGITIFVISDEPYSKIIYDGVKVPQMLSIFKNTIIVNSFSKSLGLAGARIGYIAVSSNIENVDLLIDALTYCNRTLGFVNAPGLFQKVIADSLDVNVNVEEYKKRRDFLYEKLTALGFEIIKPEGAFYLFPKALIEDDVKFVNAAMKYNLLLVPGSGFGCKGYFRMSYCVKFDMIERSISAFEKLAAEFKK